MFTEDLTEFAERRVDDVTRKLKENDKEYEAMKNELHDYVINLSGEKSEVFSKTEELHNSLNSVEFPNIYLQGFRDCMRLFAGL